jgi:hypothetical protein
MYYSDIAQSTSNKLESLTKTTLFRQLCTPIIWMLPPPIPTWMDVFYSKPMNIRAEFFIFNMNPKLCFVWCIPSRRFQDIYHRKITQTSNDPVCFRRFYQGMIPPGWILDEKSTRFPSGAFNILINNSCTMQT